MTSQIARNSDEKSLSDELAGAFDWWRDAGVDCDFADGVVDRLAEAAADREAAEEAAKPAQPEPNAAPAKPSFAPQAVAEVEQIGGNRTEWPQTLEAFREWWLSEPSLDIGGAGPRIAPHGEAGAELMIMVSQPEDADREILLSGPHGKLLAGFLRAAGISKEKCYIASLLPRSMPVPDWNALAAAGMGEIALHHIGLAAPTRVLALGRNILPLLGHDQAQGPAQVTPPQGNTGSIPVLGAPGLEELLRSAPRRKKLWHDWLDWSG